MPPGASLPRAELVRGPEVERSAPPSGQKDQVVVVHVQIGDRQRVGDLLPEVVVGQEPVQYVVNINRYYILFDQYFKALAQREQVRETVGGG